MKATLSSIFAGRLHCGVSKNQNWDSPLGGGKVAILETGKTREKQPKKHEKHPVWALAHTGVTVDCMLPTRRITGRCQFCFEAHFNCPFLSGKLCFSYYVDWCTLSLKTGLYNKTMFLPYVYPSTWNYFLVWNSLVASWYWDLNPSSTGRKWRGQEATDQAERAAPQRARGICGDWPCRKGNLSNKQARKGRRAEADVHVLESFNTGWGVFNRLERAYGGKTRWPWGRN